MRKKAIINALIGISCLINYSYGAFWDVINDTPLFDGKTLSGHEVTSSFRVQRVDGQKQAVFKLEDDLREDVRRGNVSDDPSASNKFSALNQLACQANVYALDFLASVLQAGTLELRHLPNVSVQPERAEFFKTIQELSIAYLTTKSESKKEETLRQINSLILMQKLFDVILDLEDKTAEQYNVIISEIIEVLVKKLGKSRSALADKFGISRSSIDRIYHKQALGSKATSPTSVGKSLALMLPIYKIF